MIGDGVFTLNGALKAKAGVTISGEGDKTVLRNGQILVQSSNVVIKSLRMEGTNHLIITPDRRAISDILVQDVSATVGKVESAFSVLTNRYTVSDVTFLRVSVTNSASAGIMLSGSAPISDVRIESCKVINSGKESRYNDWVTGFILAQNAEIRNLLVFNCEASGNWESGFFLKPQVAKSNVVLRDLIANNNGQKTNFQEGYGYLLDESITVINCTGVGNKGGLSNLDSLPEPEPSPVASKVALTLDANNIEMGKRINAYGVLTASSGIAGAQVSVKITLPDGSVANPAPGATVTTDSEGKFAVSYVPAKAGAYKFTATYAGNSQYTASSVSANFDVVAPAPEPEPVATKLTLNMGGASVETGKTMTANGVLTGTTGLAGAQVSVKVHPPRLGGPPTRRRARRSLPTAAESSSSASSPPWPASTRSRRPSPGTATSPPLA